MTAIRWPADFRPDIAPVHSHNVLEIDAPAAVVWAWLVRAQRWPEWYRNCRSLRMEDGSAELTLGTHFIWTTLGVRVDTTVEEFEPPLRLAWRGHTVGGRGYHAWLLEPRGEGCRVTTDECQRGLLPWLARALLRRALIRAHDAWLADLARIARTGPPPVS
jgi:hypothetical protein